jgi:hypothetical protein
MARSGLASAEITSQYLPGYPEENQVNSLDLNPAPHKDEAGHEHHNRHVQPLNLKPSSGTLHTIKYLV